jgi:hypothetical protein
MPSTVISALATRLNPVGIRMQYLKARSRISPMASPSLTWLSGYVIITLPEPFNVLS